MASIFILTAAAVTLLCIVPISCFTIGFAWIAIAFVEQNISNVHSLNEMTRNSFTNDILLIHSFGNIVRDFSDAKELSAKSASNPIRWNHNWYMCSKHFRFFKRFNEIVEISITDVFIWSLLTVCSSLLSFQFELVEFAWQFFWNSTVLKWNGLCRVFKFRNQYNVRIYNFIIKQHFNVQIPNLTVALVVNCHFAIGFWEPNSVCFIWVSKMFIISVISVISVLQSIAFLSLTKVSIGLRSCEFYFSSFGRLSWYAVQVNLGNWCPINSICSMMRFVNVIGTHFHCKCNKCSSLWQRAHNSQPSYRVLEMFSATEKHSARYHLQTICFRWTRKTLIFYSNISIESIFCRQFKVVSLISWHSVKWAAQTKFRVALKTFIDSTKQSFTIVRKSIDFSCGFQ